jgi:hypothetical protein
MSYKPGACLPICHRALRDYDDLKPHRKGDRMSMQSEGKDAKGRNYDQVTKDGTSSAGSLGTGGTGDIGRMSGGAGNAQSDTRTDDLMTTGSEKEQRQGYRPSEPGAIETGMEGIVDKGNKP